MESPSDFNTLKYEGRRFAGTLPLALAADLVAYSEVIWEAARWLYKQENPGRKRVPRGFSEGISLHLAEIEEGSTKLKILLVGAQTLFAPFLPALEQAKEAIEETVLAAANPQVNVSLSHILPISILKKLGKIGKNLQPGEQLLFGSSAALNQATREAILFGSGESRVARTLQVRARVFELDQKARTCKLETLSGGLLTVTRVAEESYATVFSGSVAYEEGSFLLLSGTGYYNRQGQPETFEIETADELESLDMGLQLEGLAQLPQGWYNGTGDPYNRQDLEDLARLFDSNLHPGATLPHIFPVPTGGVQMEWDLPAASVQLEWPLDGSSGFLFALDKATGKILEENLTLNDEKNTFAQLNEALQNHGFIESQSGND